MQSFGSNSPRLPQGFTLVELMVVIAIIAILSAMAAPAFQTLVGQYQIQSTAEELQALLYRANTEAVRRSGFVQIGKHSTTGSNPCPTSQQWSCGVRLLADTDKDGSHETVLHEMSIPNGVTLRNMTNSAATLQFNRWGQANGINALRFVITKPGIHWSNDRTICVSSGQRIRIVKGSDNQACSS